MVWGILSVDAFSHAHQLVDVQPLDAGMDPIGARP